MRPKRLVRCSLHGRSHEENSVHNESFLEVRFETEFSIMGFNLKSIFLLKARFLKVPNLLILGYAEFSFSPK